MNRNRILALLGIIVLLIIMIYSFTGNDPAVVAEKYNKQIEAERREKNGFLRRDETSPFVINGIDFKGLNYFAPDLDYKINANFIPSERSEILKLPTNDGKEAIYVKKGYAEFSLSDEKLRLLVLMSTPAIDDKAFIPFADATSGQETYGGGRYLEATLKEEEIIELDFNTAYNPYCAYAPSFSCPLPPAENYLSVAIYAGEKNYD